MEMIFNKSWQKCSQKVGTLKNRAMSQDWNTFVLTELWIQSPGSYVEKSTVTNFNPTTIARMRRWLFGSMKSAENLSDFDFLRLIFSSCGYTRFEPIHGDIGHKWVPRYSTLAQEFKSMG
jgi:hypothetical protein